MPDIITTYLLSDPEQAHPMGREEFYDGQIALQKQGGKLNRAAGTIYILLFTPERKVIVQKRSLNKKHNPGLLDKSIGCHISFGDSFMYSATVAMLSELHVPSVILPSAEDFSRSFRLLKEHLGQVALLQYVDARTTTFHRVREGQDWLITNSYNFYMGVFGGNPLPADKEVGGVELFTLPELKEALKKTPALFTTDLTFLLEKYENKINTFIQSIA